MIDTPRTAAVLAKQPNGGFGLDKSQCIAQWYDHSSQLERELAEAKLLLVEARDDVAELLERMKTEGWHRDDRIECHVALLSRIDSAIKEQK
jgi:hypothetical protein